MNLLHPVKTQTQKATTRIGKTIFVALEKLVARSSLIGDSIFFQPEQFSWVPELEANWQVIRQELDEVLKRKEDLPNYQDISRRQTRISNDHRWKTYFFYAYGLRAEKNCQRCPETTKLIEKVPGLRAAFFSILAPQKHIPEHRGKYKGVIRYHLGLIVPEPRSQCRIRIEDQVAYWEEGKSLIFDDTFRHEVWNDTDGYRVVLFMDVSRPLKFPVSILNWLISRAIAISPIVRDAKVNHEQWEKQFEALTK